VQASEEAGQQRKKEQQKSVVKDNAMPAKKQMVATEQGSVQAEMEDTT
jgi:hypothetical protein